MSEMGGAEDEWHIPASDGEGDEWEPEPKRIVEMYNKLAKGESLPLEWTLPIGGRRSPSPERDETEEAMEDDSKEEEKEEEKQEPTEFDFDDATQETVTPKRAPGSAKTSRSAQKRVATLEKIMGDIVRHRKMNTPVRGGGDSAAKTSSAAAATTQAATPTTTATTAAATTASSATSSPPPQTTTTTTTAAATAATTTETVASEEPQTPSKPGGNLSPKRL